jgi:hypothetical protein
MAERVVNIIGMGASSRDVPDHGENWGINVAYKLCPRMDKLFFFDEFKELMFDDSHIPPLERTFTEMLKNNPNVELISKIGAPVNDQDGNKLTDVKAFPIQEAIYLASGCYFTSTISYIIAYAILEKVDRIRLYGFEVWSGADRTEYSYQRQAVEFWLGLAIGKGIKVELPYVCMLAAMPSQSLYGYADFHLKK